MSLKDRSKERRKRMLANQATDVEPPSFDKIAPIATI